MCEGVCEGVFVCVSFKHTVVRALFLYALNETK